MTQPKILMCPPDFYGIDYEINAWMNRERPNDPAASRAQWLALREMLAAAGAEVQLLAPRPGLPDLVFTANAALIYRDRAILAHFRHEQRQGEELHDEAWLSEHGFHVERSPAGCYFEGAGDALFCGDTLYAGYRLRSDARGRSVSGSAAA
jgi:N-dimethylarginine dimethylaminohydrolase